MSESDHCNLIGLTAVSMSGGIQKNHPVKSSKIATPWTQRKKVYWYVDMTYSFWIRVFLSPWLASLYSKEVLGILFWIFNLWFGKKKKRVMVFLKFWRTRGNNDFIPWDYFITVFSSNNRYAVFFNIKDCWYLYRSYQWV